MAGEWLSVFDYASQKGISVSTVRRYVKSRKVRYQMVQGKYYILVEDKADTLCLEFDEVMKENQRLKEEIVELKMLVGLLEKNDGPPEIPHS